MRFWAEYKLNKLLKKARTYHEKRERGENIDVKNETKIILALAKFYDIHLYDRKFPHAAILASEYYRAAAILGDVTAQYEYAKRQLDQARFWEAWANDIYSVALHKEYAKRCYEEVFAYLKLAEDSGSAFAKRLHGMAYVNGWGVEKNKDKGFQLIVDSIEDEGAWDRATQIFTELGLNTPEFFSSIMTVKQRRGV